MLKLDLPELVGRADSVVVGTVKSASSRWTTDKRYIVTDTILQVDETVHGPAQREIVVRRLGGTVDGVGMYVAGVAQLAPGERVVLFTERRGVHRVVVGMQQGAWRLSRDAKGRELVQRDLTQLGLMKRSDGSSSGKGARAPLELYHADSTERPLTLRAFISQVKDTIKACNKAPSRCR